MGSISKIKYHNFEKYLKNFEEYINVLENNKFPADQIHQKRIGEKTFLNLKGLKNFKGLYAFWKKEDLMYVGVSKYVINKLFQEIKGNTYKEAIFAHKIAYADNKDLPNNKVPKPIIKKIQDTQISKMQISYIEINNDIELYLFEIFAALYFESLFNTFEIE